MGGYSSDKKGHWVSLYSEGNMPYLQRNASYRLSRFMSTFISASGDPKSRFWGEGELMETKGTTAIAATLQQDQPAGPTTAFNRKVIKDWHKIL